MRLIAALVFTVSALAAPQNAPLWALSFPGKLPSAVAFDAGSGALFVSLRDRAGGGEIARVSLSGKLEQAKVSVSKGPPGPLRAYGGRIYWISGNSVESHGEEGTLSEGTVPPELGDPTDIALTGRGVIYLGMSRGALVHFSGGTATVSAKGLPITGLFLLQDTLHILRGRRLQAITVSGESDPESSSQFFCATDCHALERTSRERWLTVNGSKLLEVNAKGTSRPLLEEKNAEIGRPAYVYRKEPKDDFYVVPFPAAGEIRAYRVNAPLK